MLTLLSALLVLAPAPQGKLPKPTQTASQAAKGARNLRLRLPRLMLLPLTNDMAATMPKAMNDEIVNGYTAGINETVKTPKGASYEVVPIATVQAALQKLEAPYLSKDKDDHTVWDVAKMLIAAKAVKADFLGVPCISEMTFTPAKNQSFSRGYLTVYRVSDSKRVIKEGWLGGQSTGLGLTTPYAIARSYAREDIPRRFWEDYSRENWPSPKS